MRANAEARLCLELLARVKGELVDRHEVAVRGTVAPELDAVIEAALRKSAEAAEEYRQRQASGAAEIARRQWEGPPALTGNGADRLALPPARGI